MCVRRLSRILQDDSDPQYHSFRSNIPALIVLAFAHITFKYIYNRFYLPKLHQRGNLHLIPYLLTFSILMLLGLHGSSILKIFAILVINFALSKSCGKSIYGPVLTWIFNLAVLVANELNEGYRFGSLHSSLQALVRPRQP
jgi:protein-cysteine N-palmitoyltransferase HHAT